MSITCSEVIRLQSVVRKRSSELWLIAMLGKKSLIQARWSGSKVGRFISGGLLVGRQWSAVQVLDIRKISFDT